jgi:hypothetical protein
MQCVTLFYCYADEVVMLSAVLQYEIPILNAEFRYTEGPNFLFYIEDQYFKRCYEE